MANPADPQPTATGPDTNPRVRRRADCAAAASLEGLQLRAATADDALCLSVLAMQVFLDTYATDGIRAPLAREVLSTYSEAVFLQTLADPHTRIAVAAIGDCLVGYAQVTLGAAPALAPPGPPAELRRLYVQAPFTDAGLGTRLLREAERLAVGAGARILWLTAWVHNARARAFYARRGYTDHGLTYFTFEGESHENRLLARSLVTGVAT